MFKFALKVGLAAGATYYVSEQGVWKDSNETTKLYEKMYQNVSPYLAQAKAQIPFTAKIKLPELPSTNRISFVAKQYWNSGVSTTFVFLSDLPRHASTLTNKGVDAAMSNPEIKKFVASFSGTPQQSEPQKK